jgi:glycosyltransferase involved in cell wall biosynthesis
MTHSSSLISVIIPCFNQARFLPEAVESVRRQTYAPTEIVVVDDGSTDATPDVARGLAGVRFKRQRNQGPAAARNTGIRESTGGYLLFLDADDRLLPHALEVGMRHLAARPECAFVSGHCRYIDEDGSPGQTPEQPLVEENHYLALLYRNYIWAGSTALHRREPLEAVGAYRPSKVFRGAEDYDLYLRIAGRFPVSCHGEVVSEYRQYSRLGASVSNDPGTMLRATLTALRDQWPRVKGNRDYEQQYVRGVEHKKRLWGGLVLSNLDLRAPDADRRRRAFGWMLLLLRYDPPALFKHIGRGLRRSVPHD